MNQTLAAARRHLDQMQGRIDRQHELVDRLPEGSEDRADALRRLRILESALELMRPQLRQLLPTELLDQKRRGTKAG
jgi:hypothetical protein